jgi:hypothetical protein
LRGCWTAIGAEAAMRDVGVADDAILGDAKVDVIKGRVSLLLGWCGRSGRRGSARRCGGHICRLRHRGRFREVGRGWIGMCRPAESHNHGENGQNPKLSPHDSPPSLPQRHNATTAGRRFHHATTAQVGLNGLRQQPFHDGRRGAKPMSRRQPGPIVRLLQVDRRALRDDAERVQAGDRVVVDDVIAGRHGRGHSWHLVQLAHVI